MTGSARVAALLCHRIQPRGCERGVLRQRLDDEGKVGINDRGCSCALGLGHARLRQHPIDCRVMNAELGGNGMRAPVFYKVIAKNLRFECLTDSQWPSPSMWSKKVTSEEGIAFAVTNMAVNNRLSAIALVFLMSFQCAHCEQQ